MMDYGFIKVVKQDKPVDVGVDYKLSSEPGAVEGIDEAAEVKNFNHGGSDKIGRIVHRILSSCPLPFSNPSIPSNAKR
jgi:hypothetical protein